MKAHLQDWGTKMRIIGCILSIFFGKTVAASNIFLSNRFLLQFYKMIFEDFTYFTDS